MGRIDVHAHLLPGIDDGCQTVEESIDCARLLVQAGYSDCFCTPHIWPNLPENNVQEIPRQVADLQGHLERAAVKLRLHPGGEMNLRADFMTIPSDQLVTFGMAGRYAMIDLWAERLPDHFEPSVRWMHSLGMKVILAHPERMRAVQDDPMLGARLVEMGVLLQGNLQCFNDPPHMRTRVVAERFLRDGLYFVLGSDLHGPPSLPHRLAGFERARRMVDVEMFDRLTIGNASLLIENYAGC